MGTSYINPEAIDKFSFDSFKKRWPYPWVDFEQFLFPDAFERLHHDFPALDLFEYHKDLYRLGQRPHNRYFLAYETSPYHQEPLEESVPGIAKLQDLAESWQQFMAELNSPLYRDFIKKSLDISNYTARYAWHIGINSSEVSPHLDHTDKLGTHIFYFNTNQDWDPAWGGQIIVMGDKLVPGNAPEFSDFTTSHAVNIIDNHSFFFKNGPKAWHGVKSLNCPFGKHRKLFNVIIEH